jgi:antitoxin component of MazEF toxin-antitoxin module|tara:strand:- start:12663 stop:12971 length:309 start_codon:yes stop_codon:yes gene_type:complete
MAEEKKSYEIYPPVVKIGKSLGVIIPTNIIEIIGIEQKDTLRVTVALERKATAEELREIERKREKTNTDANSKKDVEDESVIGTSVQNVHKTQEDKTDNSKK